MLNFTLWKYQLSAALLYYKIKKKRSKHLFSTTIYLIEDSLLFDGR